MSDSFNKVILRARVNLSLFVIDTAMRVAREEGVWWDTVYGAPSTFSDMVAAWEKAKITGSPYKVEEAYSDSSVFMSRQANYAMRFWHDHLHISGGYETDKYGEYSVAEKHLEQSPFLGYSLENALLWADTWGMSAYEAKYGHFPTNQLELVYALITTGRDHHGQVL